MATQITSENEFNLDGVDYVAVHDAGDTCKRCAFNWKACHTLNLPRCISETRKDKRDVVFIQKPNRS